MEKRFVPLISSEKSKPAPLIGPAKKQVVSLKANPEPANAVASAAKFEALRESRRLEVVKALTTAGYYRSSDSGGLAENNREMLVLNFDNLSAPRTEAEENLLQELIEEVSASEPAVVEHFRAINRDQAELTDHRFDLKLAGLRGETIAVEQGVSLAAMPGASRFQPLSSPKKQLAKLSPTQFVERVNFHAAMKHPDWYLGFWDDSKIVIKYSVVTDGGSTAPGTGGGSYQPIEGDGSIQPGVEDTLGDYAVANPEIVDLMEGDDLDSYFDESLRTGVLLSGRQISSIYGKAYLPPENRIATVPGIATIKFWPNQKNGPELSFPFGGFGDGTKDEHLFSKFIPTDSAPEMDGIARQGNEPAAPAAGMHCRIFQSSQLAAPIAGIARRGVQPADPAAGLARTGLLPPVGLSDDIVSVIRRKSKKSGGEKKGTLMVYQASFWRQFLNEERNAIDTNIFDHLLITIRARKKIKVKSIEIVLNGQTILDFDCGNRTLEPGEGHLFVKYNHVDEGRRKKLLYKDGTWTPVSPPVIQNGRWAFSPDRSFSPITDYDLEEIANNPVLVQAAKDLGQSWSPKYGSEWKKFNGKWDYIPEVWCSEFASWALRESGEFPDLESKSKTQEMEEFFDDIDNGRQFVSAKDTKNNWMEFAARIKPGAYVALQNSNHSTLFINWIGPNGATGPGLLNDGFYPDYESLLSDLEATEPGENTYPGSFNPNYALNWFKAIGGNQGGVVNIKYIAVARLRPRQRDWIINLTNQEKDGKGVVVWCEVTSQPFLKKYDGFGLKVTR